MENQHPCHWWNIAAQENKRLTGVRKTSIYINMQRHLLQSWVTCWFKSSAGETCSCSALPAVAGATLGNRNYWRGFRWTKTFPLAKRRHTGNWNEWHTPTVFHLSYARGAQCVLLRPDLCMISYSYGVAEKVAKFMSEKYLWLLKPNYLSQIPKQKWIIKI